jgi:twitching motility two-component system response regulator PilG
MTYSPNSPTDQPTEQPKFSPAKVIHKFISEERSGRLTLTDPNDSSIQWCVYFGGGQVHFAGSLMGVQERLVYILNKESLGLDSSFNADLSSDYQAIYQYWQSQQLPLSWVRQALSVLTQEALIQFLAIPQASLKYEPTIGLDPLLLSVPFRQIILPVRDRITQWSQSRAVLSSPFQRPCILDQDQCLQLVWSDSRLREQFQDISHFMDKNLTLYEMAYCLSKDVLELASSLKPLLDLGGLGVQPYHIPETEKLPIVACVDDSPTIQQFVKMSLEPSGYEVLSFLNPSEAIATLLACQPALILMDIEMPEIDGYELCRRARQFEVLRNIPIIMLTGREGIIDRMRARIAGCSGYLTKPFNPQELLNLVQKQAQVQSIQPV